MRERRSMERFAWHPVRTVSGKWLWWQQYVKLEKYIWGMAGDLPLVEKEYYTVNEWLLEEIKHPKPRRPPPPTFRHNPKQIS